MSKKSPLKSHPSNQPASELIELQACVFQRTKESRPEYGVARVTHGFNSYDVSWIVNSLGNKIQDVWSYTLILTFGSMVRFGAERQAVPENVAANDAQAVAIIRRASNIPAEGEDRRRLKEDAVEWMKLMGLGR